MLASLRQHVERGALGGGEDLADRLVKRLLQHKHTTFTYTHIRRMPAEAPGEVKWE